MEQALLFIFLILFPFGQVIRLGILQPIDLVAGLAALWVIVKKVPRPGIFKYFETFLLVALFSWLFSIFLFRQAEVLYGLLYLLRLAAYFYFFVYVRNFLKKAESERKLLLNSLLVVSVVSAFFGWIQFFTYPDIKVFFEWGWDMHLFRLVGTFLDPTFLGIILVFGLIISVTGFLESQRKKYLLIILFLLISLAFTYSRASYLALVAGLMAIGFYKKKIKEILFVVLGLGILVMLLPTARNHSIEFFRSFSAIARIENYQTTLSIFKKSPIFGVGYDNLCIAYQKYVGPQSFSSHACSGSDSSILFILATTGIAGFVAFLFLLIKVWGLLAQDYYSVILTSSGIALLIHSLFSNSMFYPWVLGYLAILLALSERSGSKV